MANQKTAHHYAAAAIRRHYRRGLSVEEIAALYDQSEYIIEKVLLKWTIEAAAKVLYSHEQKPQRCSKHPVA